MQDDYPDRQDPEKCINPFVPCGNRHLPSRDVLFAVVIFCLFFADLIKLICRLYKMIGCHRFGPDVGFCGSVLGQNIRAILQNTRHKWVDVELNTYLHVLH